MIDIAWLQERATSYAREVFGTVAFPGMPDDGEAFSVLADVIVAQLARAYATGCMEGAERSKVRKRR